MSFHEKQSNEYLRTCRQRMYETPNQKLYESKDQRYSVKAIDSNRYTFLYALNDCSFVVSAGIEFGLH